VSNPNRPRPTYETCSRCGRSNVLHVDGVVQPHTWPDGQPCQPAQPDRATCGRCGTEGVIVVNGHLVRHSLPDRPGEPCDEPADPTPALATCPRCRRDVPTIRSMGGDARFLRHDHAHGGRCRMSGQPITRTPVEADGGDDPDPVSLMVIHILSERNLAGRHSDLAVAISDLTRFVNDAWEWGFAAGVAAQLVVIDETTQPGRAAAKFFAAARRPVDPDDTLPPTPDEEARILGPAPVPNHVAGWSINGRSRHRTEV